MWNCAIKEMSFCWRPVQHPLERVSRYLRWFCGYNPKQNMADRPNQTVRALFKIDIRVPWRGYQSGRWIRAVPARRFYEIEVSKPGCDTGKKNIGNIQWCVLADVVGLGKTFITALLLQQIHGRTLVVCPPVLKEYWKDSLFDFGIRSFEVESLGKLEHIIKKGLDRYDYVVVDEAHRFRNENTLSYANLLDICRGKKK